MEVNLPVWKYYEPGFVDPLYQPYQRKSVKASPSLGEDCYIKVNSFARQGPPEMVYPELVRNGWGKSFQRMFSYDPCPHGWIKGADNWCIEGTPEFTPLFYTEKAFVPKNQYHPGNLRMQGRKWRSNYGYEDRNVHYAPLKGGHSYLI